MSEQTTFENEEELLSSLALPGIFEAPVEKGERLQWNRKGEFIAAYGGRSSNGNVSADAVDEYDLGRFDEVHITHPEYSRDGNMKPRVGDDRFYAIFTEEGAMGMDGASLSFGGPHDLQFSANGHMRKLNVNRPARFEVLGYAVEGRSEDTDVDRVILRLKLVQSGFENVEVTN